MTIFAQWNWCRYFFCKILEFWLAFGYLFLSIIVDERNRDRTAFPSTL